MTSWQLLDLALALRDLERFPKRGTPEVKLTSLACSARSWTCKITWADEHHVIAFDPSREVAVRLAATRAFELFGVPVPVGGSHKAVQSQYYPDDWLVKTDEDDARAPCFCGPDARQLAEEYAAFKNAQSGKETR